MNDMQEPEYVTSCPTPVGPALRADSALLHLRGKMQRAIERQAQEMSAFDVDEDPQAILRIDERSHPLQRFLDEGAPGVDNQRNLRNRITTCYRLIVGVDGPVPWDRLYAYPWHLLSPDDLERFRHGLVDSGYKPASRNAMRSTLRSIVHNCRRAGLISATRAQSLLDHLSLERFDRPIVGRAIPEEEISLLFKALQYDDPWRTARDRAMVAILATTGIRVSELCSIRLTDLDLGTGWIHIPMTKNGTSHRVPLAQTARAYVLEWLRQRGDEPGYLFLALPTRFNSAMCMQVVKRALDRACEVAGVPHCTSHDFRRTLATRLLRTHDASVVMRLLNHKSLNSTLVYDRAGEDLHAAAIESLPLPDVHALDDGEA